ncbi:IBR/half ring-finger domain containing protein [Nitzschia inconspicua]|uniref:RBR-type E3 ubiquitin transferase n=1 Tax=Nitzschia inconspicua TaxID=303405 RepID=A0A9K3KEQ4_9STRA|nr:IBR/half ring-finger domain containing protein [Nitzschia inconspicua]
MTSKSHVAAQIAEDAVSLARVRNRFSKANDLQLPKIMKGLLPKLLKRLEEYSVTIKRLDEEQERNGTITVVDSVTISHSRKAQQDIHGIFAAALERIRGNPSMPINALIPELLEFVGSKNAVVGTWTLALLQSGVSRLTAQSLDPNSVAILIKSLGELHHTLQSLNESSNGTDTAENNFFSEAATQALEPRWIHTSWLLMDFVMILSGHKPLVDWDVEHFDPKLSQQINLEAYENSPYKVSRTLAAEFLINSDSKSMVGLMSLLLDLVSFWPDSSSSEMSALSPLASKRMNHRSKTMKPSLLEQNRYHHFDHQQRPRQENHPELPMHFQRQVRHRGPDSSWSETTKLYLRYVKLEMVRFAIWPIDRGIFRVDGNAGLLLSLCAANFDSMHGRMAIDFLNRRKAKRLPIPINVEISLLILIVGEETSRDTIVRFKSKNHDRCWEQLLGSLMGPFHIQRPPLPNDVALRAAQYLIDYEVNENNSTVLPTYTSLMMELYLALCRRHDEDLQYLAIRLAARFCDSLPKKSLPETALDVKPMVMKVLRNVVDMGLADLDGMRRTPRGEEHLPLGVPAPFNRRQDLDRLLNSHRQGLRRKRLKRDEAREARKEAYRLICLLPLTIFDSDEEIMELPNLLLQCAVYEDRYLEYYVVKAIDQVLNACIEKIKNGQVPGKGDGNLMLQQQANMLLPSLLETVCSEDVSVRRVGMQWVKRLLMLMDGEAAVYLASHLVKDEDSSIARSAGELLSRPTIPANGTITAKMEPVVKFYNMGTAEEAFVLRQKLEERVLALSVTLNLSPESCQNVLLHYEFSVPEVVSSLREDNENVLRMCGLGHNLDVKIQSNFSCGICYEDVDTSNGYSLQCGHQFCTSCWCSYLEVASGSKSAFLDLRCPQTHCSRSLLRNDIQVISSTLVCKWDHYLLESFIELDPSHRYCPGPGCQFVASIGHPNILPPKVTCTSCITSFCFRCGERPHDPATCDDFLAWKRLKESSRFWMKHHSKPCPGCRAPIEKNGGCNHVHCSSCQTDFCWLCLAVLNRHLEPHNCSRYDPAESAEDDFERHALFTATRFEAHDQAEEFAFEQSKAFRPEKLLEAFWFLDEEDCDIMCRGLGVLVQARCFLKHSYIASLGMRADEVALQKHERQHSCLEMFTERLSQLTEMNMHRFYLEQGENGLKRHFQRLAFFSKSVAKYQERMSAMRHRPVIS